MQPTCRRARSHNDRSCFVNTNPERTSPLKANKHNIPHTGTVTAPRRSGRHPACRRGRHLAARTGARTPERADNSNGHSARQDARLYGRQDACRYDVGLTICAPHASRVRSVTDSDGKRLITLCRFPNSARTFLSARLRRKNTTKLPATFAPEELSAFQPLVRVPRPMRRRFTYPLALQLRNAC